jgi:aspartate carbamoyltransferase catalytic subunit
VKRRHLLGLRELEPLEILEILDAARSFREVLDRPIKKVPALRGITVCNAFFEPSTRTRISFELAAKRLSADVLNFSTGGSSVSKGETLKDTVRNIEAMQVEMVVLRHGSSGAAHFLARHVAAHVVNAGDGQHEHPTQALLDLYTIREKLKRLQGVRVAIIGDVLHSRVARSNIWGLTKMGAKVVLAAPNTLLPPDVRSFGVHVTTKLEEALDGADVIYLLRLQRERQAGGFLPSLREYARTFGLRREHLDRIGRDALIMHPGPVNRGVEADNAVADGDRSMILDQVTNGVAIRMAVLFLLWTGPKRAPVVREMIEEGAPDGS